MNFLFEILFEVIFGAMVEFFVYMEKSERAGLVRRRGDLRPWERSIGRAFMLLTYGAFLLIAVSFIWALCHIEFFFDYWMWQSFSMAGFALLMELGFFYVRRYTSVKGRAVYLISMYTYLREDCLCLMRAFPFLNLFIFCLVVLKSP